MSNDIQIPMPGYVRGPVVACCLLGEIENPVGWLSGSDFGPKAVGFFQTFDVFGLRTLAVAKGNG